MLSHYPAIWVWDRPVQGGGCIGVQLRPMGCMDCDPTCVYRNIALRRGARANRAGRSHRQRCAGRRCPRRCAGRRGDRAGALPGGRQARVIVVLLPGGDGIIGFDGGGGVHQLGGNFLVRTLGQWVAQGFAVVLPDAPNGTSLTGQRHLPASADAISRAIDFGRSRAALPVWLIGTSAGTTAAVNGAAHLGSKVSGAVLTSSVTRRTGASGETIFDAEPGA